MTEQQPDEFAPGDAEQPRFEVPDDASSLVDGTAPAAPASETEQLQGLVAERTADLQRLHAEYVNYKRRVDRERDLARSRGVESVVADLLPVLDSIEAASQHGELSEGFRLVSDALGKLAAKHGLVTYGAVGEPFDPELHEALMHMPYEGAHDVTVVAAVMQRGAKLNDRVIRPARVGVADPD